MSKPIPLIPVFKPTVQMSVFWRGPTINKENIQIVEIALKFIGLSQSIKIKPPTDPSPNGLKRCLSYPLKLSPEQLKTMEISVTLHDAKAPINQNKTEVAGKLCPADISINQEYLLYLLFMPTGSIVGCVIPEQIIAKK